MSLVSGPKLLYSHIRSLQPTCVNINQKYYDPNNLSLFISPLQYGHTSYVVTGESVMWFPFDISQELLNAWWSVDIISNKLSADNVEWERCSEVISSMKVRTNQVIHKDTVGPEEVLKKEPKQSYDYERIWVRLLFKVVLPQRLFEATRPTRAVGTTFPSPRCTLHGGDVRIRKSRLYLPVCEHLKYFYIYFRWKTVCFFWNGSLSVVVSAVCVFAKMTMNLR